ncbi:hypothetical protein JB92DRAFT_2763755, partial [Gautieria morchelliformis]
HKVLKGSKQTLTGPRVPMDIRLYSPPGDGFLVDDTVACVVRRIFAPASGNVMMDAFSIIPYPGDASSEEYDDNLPNDTSVRSGRSVPY